MSEERIDALIGAAGVYFVAARLNVLGYHAALTIRNVPNVDILASSLDGACAVSIQVKTARYALRYRGRGEDRHPDHYEWSLSWKSARLSREDLFFAFVDLKEFEEMPEVFIVPSSVVHEYYEGGDPQEWKWPRYHPLVSEIEAYKNNWKLITDRLDRHAKTDR